MANNTLSGYKDLYIKTAGEYIDAMQANIAIITSDITNTTAIETLYRSAHSLKSQSAIMGYTQTASLSEFLEKTMRNVKEQTIFLDENLIGEIKNAIEDIEASINKV